MKKILLLLLFFVATFAHAATLIDGIYYNLSTSTAEVACYSSTADNEKTYVGDISIPASVTLDGKTYKVTSIGNNAFCYCSGITSITLPTSITSIGDKAFLNCKGLTKLSIPKSVQKVGEAVFSGCILYPLYFEGDLTYISKYFLDGCYGDICGTAKLYRTFDYEKSKYSKFNFYKSKFYITDTPNWGDHVISYLKGVKFYEPYLDEYSNIKDVKFVERTEEMQYEKTSTGYKLFGLFFNRTYKITVSYTDNKGLQRSEEVSFTTKEPEISIDYTRTQTAITVNSIKATTDESCTLKEIEVLAGRPAINVKEFPHTYTYLAPDKSYNFMIYVRYNEGVTYEKNIQLSTSTISPRIEVVNKSASSLELCCAYDLKDAVVAGNYITQQNPRIQYKGSHITITGLDPGTSYGFTLSYTVNEQESYKSFAFSTDGLELKTSQPKVITEGNVIVAAESNLDSEETNVGFEWRRTDWTDDFASNTGEAYLYEGHMEGYIRNLNANKLWKYRPYYLSDSGKYYYGDWVGLDPSNTSYFEATVHTYDKIQIEGNTALVKGYALRGTDPIKVQGFVYWKNVSNVKAENERRNAKSVPSTAQTIESSGQIMNATLTGLDFDSKYTYMAFVTTTEGETFYGEEKTFTTGSDLTGIESVNEERTASSVSISGYYDLNGRRITNPQHGIYVIRYSDGSSRKMLRK